MLKDRICFTAMFMVFYKVTTKELVVSTLDMMLQASGQLVCPKLKKDSKMLNGSLTEVSNVEDFIIKNEAQIKNLYRDARRFIPQDDYPDADLYTEILTSAVVVCLLHGDDVFDGSIDTEVLSDYSEGFVQNLAQVLVTTYMFLGKIGSRRT